MSCNERQAGTESEEEGYLCISVGGTRTKRLACPLSQLALLTAECWWQLVKGKNAHIDTYRDLKDEKPWQQSGGGEVKTKVTTGFIEEGSRERSTVTQHENIELFELHDLRWLSKWTSEMWTHDMVWRSLRNLLNHFQSLFLHYVIFSSCVCFHFFKKHFVS